MRLLLRILLSLASLIIVAVLTVLLIAPESIIQVLEALPDVNIVLRIAVVVVFYVLILGVLYLRVRFRPRGHGEHMLTVNSGGAVTAITVESVRERVLKAVREVPDVGNVIATLKSARGRADIDLDVTMKSDEVNIPTKQREISRAIEQVIKKQLGLRMAGPARINIRLSEPKTAANGGTSPVTTSSPVVSAAPVSPSSPVSSSPPSTASQAPVVMPPVVPPTPEPESVSAPAATPAPSPSTQPNMATITGATEVKTSGSLETTDSLPIPAYIRDRETAPTSISAPVASPPSPSSPSSPLNSADDNEDDGSTDTDADTEWDAFEALLNEGDGDGDSGSDLAVKDKNQTD